MIDKNGTPVEVGTVLVSEQPNGMRRTVVEISNGVATLGPTLGWPQFRIDQSSLANSLWVVAKPEVNHE